MVYFNVNSFKKEGIPIFILIFNPPIFRRKFHINYVKNQSISELDSFKDNLYHKDIQAKVLERKNNYLCMAIVYLLNDLRRFYILQYLL